MRLNKLILTQFKNYSFQEVVFDKGFNLLFGSNGSGKTNILDAIHYLALTKSHFVPQDKMTIQHNKDFFRVEGSFHKKDAPLHVVLKYQSGQKKFEINDRVLTRNSDHIGEIGIVFIAPDDLDIIDGLSLLRRKYMDVCLSQSNHEYLKNLTVYKKLLDQRNNYLKQMQEPDEMYLLVLNEKMSPCAHYVHAHRRTFSEAISKYFSDYYQAISNHQEVVEIEYQSDLNHASFLEIMSFNKSKDVQARITTKGIHRDELLFKINGYNLKYSGSQGQKKTFLVSLFLAQADYLSQQMDSTPILLLDDIFDKLDQDRMKFLLTALQLLPDRQIIMTDTSRDRISTIISTISSRANYLEVKSGQIKLPN